jgi:hypothetical protein
MRFKLFLIIGFICFTLNLCNAQAYLGWITKTVNFRTEPSKTGAVISSLKAGTQIFIISSEVDNDFYNIIDINTNEEGYVHKSFIKFGDAVEKNEGGLFSPNGMSSSYDPELAIYNNTNKTLTLKLNATRYTFYPHERKTITLSAGYYDYIASAPGVMPNIGTETVQSNNKYSWEFYIQTKYGR